MQQQNYILLYVRLLKGQGYSRSEISNVSILRDDIKIDLITIDLGTVSYDTPSSRSNSIKLETEQ